MPNKLTIWNQALSLIGMKTVGSIDEKSTEAMKCKLFDDTAREFVLSDHNWKFARKTLLLAESAEDNNPSWSFAYIYPSDCLVARRIYNGSTKGIIEFETARSNIEDYQIILTNLSPAYLEYTSNVTNEALFSSGFAAAYAHYLAFCIANSTTGSQQLAQAALSTYTFQLEKAKVSDTKQEYKKDNTGSSYVDVRG